MRKHLTKGKLIFLLVVLAVAILTPMQTFLAEARAVVDSVVISADEDSGSAGSGSTGSASSGESGSSGESSSETTLPFKGYVVSTTMITDSNLYDALLKLYKKTNPSYTGDNIYSDMFIDFTEINLDGRDKGISSLAGMDKLDIPNLEKFSANLNNIEAFDEKYFVNTNPSKFHTLSLAGNLISKFQITNLTGLYDINLSANKLSSINLSAIEARVQDTPFVLNVAGNRFSSMKDIVLPTKRIGHISLNIINNNISEIAEEYFSEKYTLSIGIQGFKSLEDGKYFTDTKQKLSIYKTNNPNLSVRVYRIDGDEDVVVASVGDSDFQETERLKTFSLSVGEYRYEYIWSEEGVETPAEDKYDTQRVYLSSAKFNVLPQKPNYVYVYKDKEYTSLNKVTGAVTVKVSCEEGAVIMYQVNNGEWKEGNIVECNKGGTYSIKVKAIIDGVESEVVGVWVRTSLNLYIPDGLMLALVLLIALVLFLVVLPIISKKYFKKD